MTSVYVVREYFSKHCASALGAVPIRLWGVLVLPHLVWCHARLMRMWRSRRASCGTCGAAASFSCAPPAATATATSCATRPANPASKCMLPESHPTHSMQERASNVSAIPIPLPQKLRHCRSASFWRMMMHLSVGLQVCSLAPWCGACCGEGLDGQQRDQP